MIKRFGTHNLLDGAAEARGFEPVVLFTEAPNDIWSDRVNNTHTLFRVRRQRDLVIALADWIMNGVEGKVRKHYRLVHIGIATVTPHRGIFWITFTYFGQKYAVIDEHRINAWYPPYRRGEAALRDRWWHKHTRMSNRIQQRLIDRGYIVIAGGDPNCPEAEEGYPLLDETMGVHLDRLACSEELGGWQAGGRGMSDHRRLRAWLVGGARRA